MWEKLRRIVTVRDIRNKILFTLGILLVIRILDSITIPMTHAGQQRLLSMFALNTGQPSVGLFFGMLDVFSGGSLHTFSIIALSVYPYITTTLVMQLLQPVIPKLQDLAMEGDAGRLRLSQLTRLVTVPLACLEAFSSCVMYSQEGVLEHFSLLDPRYMLDSFAIVLVLVTGVMILLWLGELITEKGIGNGISLIIFGGILAALPQTIQHGYLTATTNGGSGNAMVSVVFLLLVSLFTITGMVFMYMAQRRVPIQYPMKRSVGRKMLIGSSQATYIPMQINSAGMIPLIFASSMLLFPTVLAQYLSVSSTLPWLKEIAQWIVIWINPTTWWYWVLNSLLVFAFSYFYTYVMWQQQNLAESLQKQGAFVHGYRPGEPTNRYLMHILNRVTFGGAFFLAVATILPFVVRIGNSQLLSSTSLLIVVGVALDTLRQLEAEMQQRNYSGFLSS
jgi:preprotein translocase subunit SecY